MQIPCGIRSEVSEKENVWKIQKQGWRNIKGVVPPTRCGTLGRAFDAGPCAYVHKRSTQIQHCFCNRISKRKKCCSNPSHGFEGKASIRVCTFGPEDIVSSTVGLDEETIKKYIREQEKVEQQQIELDFDE